MSALTLLICERWDFSSSRSSSSRCAFFMASMAAGDSTAVAPSTAPPKGGFFFNFALFFKGTKPESSQRTSHCFAAPSVCAPGCKAAQELLQIPLFIS